MSEKPFWEGKTCEEMANLHVKVTFVTGAVLTGITDCSGHIRRSRNGSVVPISPSRGAERFVPYRDIESIELLDDPEYERIDNIEDVREGDEVFTLSGNKYKARAVYESMEVYADGDGFWLDKNDNTWTMRDGSLQVTCLGADDWCFTRPWFSTDSVQVLNAAPFRPAKAVEA